MTKPFSSSVDRFTPRPTVASARFVGFRSCYVISRTTLTMSANVIVSAPFFVTVPTTFDQMALSITAAAAAGKLIKLMLHDSLASGYPGALLEASGNLAADAIAVVTYAVTRTLQPYHLYHASAWSDGTPVLEASAGLGVYGSDSASDVGAGRCAGLETVTFGAAPDPFGAVSSHGLIAPHVAFRVV